MSIIPVPYGAVCFFWGREKDGMGLFKVICKTILLNNNDNMIVSYI